MSQQTANRTVLVGTKELPTLGRRGCRRSRYPFSMRIMASG